MPSKKKKYNARFPAGRIKKIMQSDEEIGKVAQAVPVIISRTLELFVESLLTKTLRITNSRNAKTLSTSHMKQCIMSEQRFDFLRELVKNIPDICVAEDEAAQSSPEEQYPDSDTPYDLSMPSTSTRARNNFMQSNGGVGSAATNANTSLRLQGHNNGSNNANPVNYSKRNSSTTSVIMHTTSIVNPSASNNKGYLPPKFTRSESTPAQMSTSSAPLSKPIWRPIETSPTTPRKRFKQQSQSMPHYGNSNNIIHNSTNPSKQQLPAPIVNFDFCTKPVVKIDYSNLPMTTTTTCSNLGTEETATSYAPLSAPVLGHHNNLNAAKANKAFDFSAAVDAPIINIDLSNMMTAPSTQAPAVNGPAVATISIGALPLTLTPASITTASPALMGIEQQRSLNAVNMATTSATSVGTTKNNALLELDEDYDNI